MSSPREPMSAIDLAWLRMERATNPMAIVGVLTLRGRLRRAALRSLLEQRMLRFSRFRQVPAHDVFGSHWQDDEQFDLDAHVHTVTLPPRAGQSHLEALASDLASTQLDPRRPLWQMHLIERYRGGSALIVRFHHCYADGIALLRVLLSLTDSNDAREHHSPGARTGSSALAWLSQVPLASTALSLTQGAAHTATDLISASLHALAHPQQTLALAGQVSAATRELAAIALLEDDPPTPLRGELSTRKQVAWADPVSLQEVKTIGHALGCTVNDVLLASIAGALGGYLRNQRANIDNVTIRALVPVNLRHPEAEIELGNRFGLVFVNLPLGERNPIKRVLRVHEHMETLKSSAQPMVALWLLSALGSLPAAIEKQAIDVLTAKATAVISNVPGPQQPLYLGGAKMDRQFFWVPQAGSIGIGVSMLTYDGRVHFGLMADRNLIAKPAAVARTFGTEFEKLLLCTISVSG